ncbi:hypothetical protein K788_00027730 [Paraburkholderia caribensis MBA4]|uniref:Uncharacterized protein n=1 Tax=Paraburkholderia caribensis MBA4 TaxID=1323664 RepID=A0A0N7JUT9_9BURK|nr:hypothetical protein K788_00027730 [Paraburkholderia caribensis MBA4]
MQSRCGDVFNEALNDTPMPRGMTHVIGPRNTTRDARVVFRGPYQSSTC